MTTRQEAVFASALRLFSEHGIDSCSVPRIAESANVSPSFIYKHYKNKEGLIKAILEEGSERAVKLIDEIKAFKEPKEVLLAMLQLPFQVNEAEHGFWKLIYQLKWRTGEYYFGSTALFMELATDAFDQLGYTYPKAEAEVLVMFLDGAATAMLLKSGLEQRALTLTCIRAKYDL